MDSRGNVGGGEGREKESLLVGVEVCRGGLTKDYEAEGEQEKGKEGAS